MSLHISCIRRIPRASLISLTLALQPVLARLKENPTDRAASNILWLFPRLVLRRDPPKTGKAQGRLSERRREVLQRHADAAPAGDCLSQRIATGRSYARTTWRLPGWASTARSALTQKKPRSTPSRLPTA